ncbi:hypothetical protein EJ08DRAFT_695349 [Tothia fuscella]|uniref:Uncharacterized protein n=1 Tax=Tothia fuscella TaxID=1048955 RepID=A0A9P4U0B6_9PEZI|nr:hypothetical protein EJ08DRAFT_695349 [Tothia fuscella]
MISAAPGTISGSEAKFNPDPLNVDMGDFNIPSREPSPSPPSDIPPQEEEMTDVITSTTAAIPDSSASNSSVIKPDIEEPVDTPSFVTADDDALIYIKTEPAEAIVWRSWGNMVGDQDDPIVLDDEDDDPPTRSLYTSSAAYRRPVSGSSADPIVLDEIEYPTARYDSLTDTPIKTEDHREDEPNEPILRHSGVEPGALFIVDTTEKEPTGNEDQMDLDQPEIQHRSLLQSSATSEVQSSDLASTDLSAEALIILGTSLVAEASSSSSGALPGSVSPSARPARNSPKSAPSAFQKKMKPTLQILKKFKAQQEASRAAALAAQQAIDGYSSGPQSRRDSVQQSKAPVSGPSSRRPMAEASSSRPINGRAPAQAHHQDGGIHLSDDFGAEVDLDQDIDLDADTESNDDDNESGYDTDGKYARKVRKYKRAKARIDRRRKDSKIVVSDEEEINFLQLTSEYELMRQTRQANRVRDQEDDDQDDSLFVAEERDALQPMDSGDEEQEELEASRRRRAANTKSSRKRARDSESDSEILARLQGVHKPKDKQPKKRSGKSSGKGKSKATGQVKGKAPINKVKDPKAKVTKSKTTQRKRPDRKNDSNLLDMGSLFTGNPIEDARNNRNRPSMPIMDSARKHDALHKLVASVPKEHRGAAGVDRNHLLSASRDFDGRGSCRTVEGQDGWKLSGMNCILKHHQLLGAAFMRRREKGTDEPKGGLCADQMGLGKTIMTLANIVNGRKPKTYMGPKTTLIVATPALITQWLNEIAKHCEPKLKLSVLKHFGKNKLETNDSVAAMMRFDIVLTTYNEVQKSYPKAEFPIQLQTAEDKNRWWQKYYHENRGLLHKVDFLRVVLDEAQCIKNHKSWTSIAARGLSAEHRWALSGTPIQNSVSELYPYFKFLKVPHTGTFKIFSANFVGGKAGPNKHGIDRLQSFLTRFMIRRTHADNLLGHPIITLPNAVEHLHWCQFNELERVIYETVRMRMIQRINRMSRSRELDANYSNILTMLLRLRQLTCHLLMLEKPMRDLLTREDHEKFYNLASEAANPANSDLSRHAMVGIRRYLQKRASGGKLPQTASFPGVRHETGREREDEDEDETEDEDENGAGPSRRADNTNFTGDTGNRHGLQFDFLKYLSTLRKDRNWEELKDRTLCAKCNDQPEDPHVTSCFHVYCKACLVKIGEDSVARNLMRPRCLECGMEYTKSKPCDQFNLATLDEDSDDSDDDAQGLGRHRKAKIKDSPRESKKDWIDMAGLDILPSSKTVAIKAQIINWIEENPNVKIILYTQFIDMIRIMEKICKVERWGYTTYHGGKNHDARDKAIKDFEKELNLRILLASLKCGGIGLNLTMAQKVIVVDPWWNSSVEQQAFCRVFRIGQEQETSMTRFVVEKTVDENMIRMQERKQHEIDRVMDGEKRKKLTITELLSLFGEVEEGDDGQPFILVEDRHTIPNPADKGDEDEMYADEA